MRRTERESRDDAAPSAREEARDAAREQARQAKEAAWVQARQVRDAARQARDQAKQARDEARSRAQWLREGAAALRDDAREGFRSAWEQAASEHPSPEGSEPGEGTGRPHGSHDWSSWLGWGDWGRWSDWPGRRSWPGPKDMGAFRDLERLARDFATDLRKVAWDSGALGGDVLTDLRSILEETLDRIRAEVFGPHEEPASEAEPPSASQENPPPKA